MTSAALIAQLGEPWQAGRVAVSGGNLAYHRTGGGSQPMVLAHGLTDNGLCWARTAQALQSHFDVIMLDARGHGDSVRMEPGEPSDPARDIAQAIAGLGISAPIVMGHSVGALAMSAMAAADPALPVMVILEDPPWFAVQPPSNGAKRQQQFREQVADFAAMTDAELTALGQHLSPSWHEAEFPAWTLSKRQVDPEALPNWGAPWRQTVAEITAPTLLLYGETERGGLVSPQVAAEAMRINSQITAVQIEGAGHNIRRENFAGFLAQVRAFVGTTKVAASQSGSTGE